MQLITVAFPLLFTTASAFVAQPIQRTSCLRPLLTRNTRFTSLFMAGFGGAGSSKKGGKKGSKKDSLTLKLKPRAQWEKYKNLKTATSIKVAVRVANEGSEVGQWFDIGMIKSEGDEFTEVAVALQKGIIVEVCVFVSEPLD